MFVTSLAYDGDLGGIAGADAACQTLANASPQTRGGTYRAWLSSAHVNSSPARRFTNLDRTGPYVLVDDPRTEIAADWEDLTSGDALGTSINITEWGGIVATSLHTWTNTLPDGLPGTVANKLEYCREWNYAGAGELGGMGENYLADPRWTSGGTNFCSEQFSLYCFEQG